MADTMDDGGPVRVRAPAGNAVKRNFPGMSRCCPTCGGAIVVTEAMCRYGQYRCKPCQSAASVDYARRNREKKRASNNAYSARHSAQRAEKTRAYREKYPEKKAAHQAVQTAIRNGTLKPQPCGVCGAADSHAHHDDYSLPLDVMWLCHGHHMERHAMLAERERTKP